MISPWRICSSLLLAAAAWGAPVAGRVELADSRDPNVRRKSDYSGVVVWLEPVRPGGVPRPPSGMARILQRDKTFSPHILAVMTGTTVDFPNLDPIYHNAFSNYDGQIFDIGLYAPGTSKSVRFTRAGVVRIFCNIHSSMSAVVVVVPSPWFATTARDGTFRIQDVPAGEYTLRVFHERATPQVLNALKQRIATGDQGMTLPPIRVSESGYLPIPHANKYGQDYPPPPDDVSLYPGARK